MSRCSSFSGPHHIRLIPTRLPAVLAIRFGTSRQGSVAPQTTTQPGAEEVADLATIESQPLQDGRNMVMMLAPHKNAPVTSPADAAPEPQSDAAAAPAPEAESEKAADPAPAGDTT